MGWLWYLLGAFGLWFVVGISTISLGPRRLIRNHGGAPGLFLLEMLQCSGCFGFWEGVLAAYFLDGAPVRFGSGFLAAVALGLVTSASNLILTGFSHLGGSDT